MHNNESESNKRKETCDGTTALKEKRGKPASKSLLQPTK